MRVLVEASPVRKSINWYRIAAYALAAVAIVGLLWAAVLSWPYVWSSEGAYDAALADGQSGWFMVTLFLGSSLLILGVMALAGFAFYIGSKLLIYLAIFVQWWYYKVKETDERNQNLTYKD